LINNAGMGLYKQFGDAALTDEEQLLELNVKAVLRLSYAAVEAMPSRGGGLILNVSSVAGFVPRGAVASYSASKAWVTMFTEALAVQHANTNLKVAVVCPGYTHTEFHERAGADMSYVPSWMWQNADEVVNEALAKARGSNPIIIPGHVYRVIIALARVLPRPLVRMAMGATNARGNKQNKQKGKAQS
jgi:short-subunit dehydrogenase